MKIRLDKLELAEEMTRWDEITYTVSYQNMVAYRFIINKVYCNTNDIPIESEIYNSILKGIVIISFKFGLNLTIAGAEDTVDYLIRKYQ